MKRIIWHWTAGTHTPNRTDREHYHFLIDGAGLVHDGDLSPEANEDTSDDSYAAHTRGCNTGAIGVALCAMAGAAERPFSSGRYPITQAQVDAMVSLLARLASRYSIPVTRETVLSHAEVQPTLGIRQSGKWDTSWLPDMERPGDPVAVGDGVRARVRAMMRPPPPKPEPTLWERFRNFKWWGW